MLPLGKNKFLNPATARNQEMKRKKEQQNNWTAHAQQVLIIQVGLKCKSYKQPVWPNANILSKTI